MPDEARTEKFGRFTAEIVKTIRDFKYLDDDRRKEWGARFVDELSRYSFEPRKKGSPRNAGCVNELEGIIGFKPTDPIQLARWNKEMLHLMYQKQRAKEIYDALIKNLQLSG